MENTLGKRLAALRREKGMTQEDMAGAMGVSPQAVSKWENDLTCPDISLLPELAQRLNVSIDELLTGKSKEQTEVRMLPPEARKPLSEMILRVNVTTSGGDKVRINLPMMLLQAAIDMGASMTDISGRSALKEIDLQQIVSLVQHGAVGDLVDVETADGDVVRVFAE